MAMDVPISPRLTHSLAAFLRLSPAQAKELVRLLRESPPTKIDDLRVVAARLVPEDNAREITFALLNLVHLQRTERASSADVLASIRGSIDRLPPRERWPAEKLEAWTGLQSALEALLALDTIVELEKLVDLQFDHDKILDHARVLTELRPVFTRDLSDVRSLLLLHTMRIDFRHGTQADTLTLSLEERDVLILKEECERAIEKSRVLRARLQSAGLHVVDDKESDS